MIVLFALLGLGMVAPAAAETEAWLEVRLEGQTPSRLWYRASAETPPQAPRPVVFHDVHGQRHDLLVHLEPGPEGLLLDLSVRALAGGEPVRFFRGSETVELAAGGEALLEVGLAEVDAPGSPEGTGSRARRERRRQRAIERARRKGELTDPVSLTVAVGVASYAPGDLALDPARSLFAWPGELAYSVAFPARGFRSMVCGEGVEAGIVRGRVRVVWTGVHQPGEQGELTCSGVATGEEGQTATVTVPLLFH